MKKLIYTLVLVLIAHCSLDIDNCEAQWVRVSDGMLIDETVWDLANNGSSIFAATVIGIFHSTNSGTNWTHVTDVPSSNSWAVDVFGTTVFAGLFGGNIYRSTNNGLNWLLVRNVTNSLCPIAFTIKGQYVFAAIWSTLEIYRSSNNGTDWFPISSGITASNHSSFAIIGNTIFLGTEGGGVYKSTNDGTDWMRVDNGFASMNDIEAIGTDLFACNSSGVFRSTNMGVDWNLTNQGITGIVEEVLAIGTNLAAGSRDGFFRSTNNGDTWEVFNEGLLAMRIYGLTADNTYIYAGTGSGGIFRRPLIEILPVSVQSTSTEVPEKYNLNQNYPNPFNPETNIEFSIPKQTNVKITVYDSQGKEISNLLNQSLSAGTYKVDFDGTNYSSGIYFYKMKTEDFVLTKSMMLLK